MNYDQYSDPYEEEYYEPSETQLLLEELKNKFSNCLNEDVKNKIKTLEIKNQELENQLADKNKEFKKLSFEVSQYERDKEKIKQDVENEFYQMNVLDVMNKATEPKDVWYASLEYVKSPKCNLCDDERYLSYTFENGTTIKGKCNCDKSIRTYKPELCETYQWEYHKTKGNEPRWDDKRKFYVDQSTSPSDKDQAAYDSYTRFKIIKVFDTAQEAINNEPNRKGYAGDRFGFTSKEECQKYCDIMNKEK